MIFPKSCAIAFLFLFFIQKEIVVTKNSGEEFRFVSIDFFQGSKRSDEPLIMFKKGEKTNTILFSELKRINLKSVASKRGITNWNAILVKNSNQKIEVILPLARIYGVDADGTEVKISSSNIDKISF